MSSAAILAVGFLVFAVLMLMWRHHDQQREEEQRGWRVRCLAAGSWAYEEKRQEGWVNRVTFEELGDYRESPHIFGTPVFPEWAAERRDQIMARLKSELKSLTTFLKMPNKALEPTPGSVTPRAGARVAPAPVVAHL